MGSVLRLTVATIQLVFWSTWVLSAKTVLGELAKQAVAGWAIFRGRRVLNVVIIKPTRYDNADGFVWRNWKGVLPSNTMATIYWLVEDVRANLRLGVRTKIIVRVYDENVQRVDVARITRLCRFWPAKSLVMVVGVQTNEFVRASDIALGFQSRGIQTIVGGFHVSGVLKQFPQDGSAISRRAYTKMGLERLTQNGVSLFAGEAEGGRMRVLLQDFIDGRFQSIYNYLGAPPDLTSEPAPPPIWSLRRRYASANSATIDACRGCPFKCRYCTIRNVQGTVIRARGIQVFTDAIRLSWSRGIRSFFFTSDNASRDPLWEERFDALIAMRREEGIEISFIMQIDTQAHKIRGFIAKAAQAGCRAAFIGLESVNPDNLKEVGKGQNHIAEYQALNDALREHGIAVEYGYMIGLPHDTLASVRQDIEMLIALGPDLVSFFVTTLLPGADDHKEAFIDEVEMNPDLNAYDSFGRPIHPHPRMTADQISLAYRAANASVYSVRNMVAILRRNKREHYWRRFWSLTWYGYALEVIERHPMVTGFIRLRDRHSRRDTFPQLNWFQFQAYNLKANIQMWRKTLRFARKMVEVWLQSRCRSEVEEKVATLVAERHAGRWVRVRISELRGVYRAQGINAPSVFKLIGQRISYRTTRKDIEAYWFILKRRLARGMVWELFNPISVRFAIVDLFLHFLFFRQLVASLRVSR